MVTTGRFRESEFHWPLSGDEFEARTVAPDPEERFIVSVIQRQVSERSSRTEWSLADCYTENLVIQVNT